jgi:lysophospholipase L1-like esterase
MPEAPITKIEDTDTSTADKPVAVKFQRKHSLGVTALEFLIMTPLAVLILEGLFTCIGVGEQNFMRPNLELGSVHIPGKLVTWRLEGFSRDSLSQAGWRDIERTIAKPADTYRVALLGDSATESLQVPLEQTFARLAEKQINQDLNSAASASSTDKTSTDKTSTDKAAQNKPPKVEVINFGVSGYSTAQELLLLQKEVVQYKPDLVVVLYSRGDSEESSVEPSKRESAEPRPYYYLDQNNQLQLDRSVLLANKEKLTSNPLLEFLRANSRIYGVFDQTNFQLNLTDKFYVKLRRLATQIASKLSGSNNGSGTSKEERPQYPAQDKFKVTQALLSQIQNTAKANNARFLLVTFPDIGNIDPIFAKQVPALLKQGQEEGFDVMELSQPFRDYKGKEDLFYQVHFASGGHKVTAQVLSKYVEGLISR